MVMSVSIAHGTSHKCSFKVTESQGKSVMMMMRIWEREIGFFFF